MFSQIGFPYFWKSAAAVGERKVKMALRFKWIFAKSAEMRVQNECLANGFPPIPGICKIFFEVIDFLPQRGFCEFQNKWNSTRQSHECRSHFGGFRESPFKT